MKLAVDLCPGERFRFVGTTQWLVCEGTYLMGGDVLVAWKNPQDAFDFGAETITQRDRVET